MNTALNRRTFIAAAGAAGASIAAASVAIAEEPRQASLPQTLARTAPLQRPMASAPTIPGQLSHPSSLMT